MKHAALIATYVAFVVLLSGCGDKTRSGPEGPAASSPPSAAELSEKLAALEKKLGKLQLDQFSASLAGPQGEVWFDPQDDKGYQAVSAPAGSMLVVLEKVEPYLDGFTVRMKLGNPSSAGYSGFKASVQWGRKFDLDKSEEHNRLAQKNIDSREFLAPGSWTIVTFNVAPATPEQVRRIGFAPTFDSIQLRSLTR